MNIICGERGGWSDDVRIFFAQNRTSSLDAKWQLMWRKRKVRLVEVSKPSPSLPEILTGIGNSLFDVDRSLKELMEDLTSTNGIQARMDGILFERLENAHDNNPILQLIKDCLRSF